MNRVTSHLSSVGLSGSPIAVPGRPIGIHAVVDEGPKAIVGRSIEVALDPGQGLWVGQALLHYALLAKSAPTGCPHRGGCACDTSRRLYDRAAEQVLKDAIANALVEANEAGLKAVEECRALWEKRYAEEDALLNREAAGVA